MAINKLKFGANERYPGSLATRGSILLLCTGSGLKALLSQIVTAGPAINVWKLTKHSHIPDGIFMSSPSSKFFIKKLSRS